MPQFVTKTLPSTVFRFRWRPFLETAAYLFLPFREWIITMLDERFARLRTHRNNIARYRGLLKTNLAGLERQFIERRLSEEQSEFELLSAGKDRHLARPDNADMIPLAGNELITDLRSQPPNLPGGKP